MESFTNKVKKCWENMRTNKVVKAVLLATAVTLAEQTIIFIFDCFKYWLFN